jgi:hypothetical protein
MKVRIIGGTYAFREHGTLKPKGKGDVFELPDAEAGRIIRLGIAEPCDHGDTSRDNSGLDVPPHTDASGGQNAAETASIDDIDGMSFEELKATAGDLGIANVSKIKSKKALIAAIREVVPEV